MYNNSLRSLYSSFCFIQLQQTVKGWMVALQVDALGIQNVGSVTEAFCLDNIAITGSSSSATTGRKLKF